MGAADLAAAAPHMTCELPLPPMPPLPTHSFLIHGDAPQRERERERGGGTRSPDRVARVTLLMRL